jgi:hypothetical protein
MVTTLKDTVASLNGIATSPAEASALRWPVMEALAPQMHLAELGPADELDAMLPGLGRSWASTLGSQSAIFGNIVVYARQWEAVAAAWARGDHALAQPVMPSWDIPLLYASGLLKKKVAAKELELCVSQTIPRVPPCIIAESSFNRRCLTHNVRVLPATYRLGVTSAGGVGTTIYASGGKALAAEAADQT